METLCQQSEPFFLKNAPAEAQVVLVTEDPLVLSHFASVAVGMEAWLGEFTAAEGRKLLSSFQRLAVWQGIIEEERARFPVADPAAVSAQADRYHMELLQGRHSRGKANRDGGLATWHKLYKARLKDRRADDLGTRLLRIAKGDFPLLDLTGEQLNFASIGPPTPLWSAVIARLEEAGCGVCWSQLPREQRVAVEVLCVDSREEAFWRAGEWAQSVVSQGNAPVRLVTGSQSDVPRWRQVLGELFEECQFELSHDHRPTAFAPLSQALELASLDRERVEFSVWSRILRSPFIGDWEREAFSRCAIDSALRRAGHHQPPLVKLVSLSRKERAHSLLPLLYGLQHKSFGDRTSCSLWSQRFEELLALASWPGDKPEDTPLEAACRLVVEESLRELSGLGKLVGNIDHSTAVQFWAQAMQTYSADLLNSQARVATVSVEFGLWTRPSHSLGFPTTWPELGRFEHLLPGASRSRLQKERKAAQINLPWSVSLQVSSADELEDLAGLAERESLFLPPRSVQSLGSVTLERWVDQPVPIEADEPVRGGASLLASQASCAYRAFARFRMRARPLETVGVGLDPRQRGNLVHDVLEAFWTQFKDQETLLKTPPEELDQITYRIITEVVARAVYELPEELDGRGFELERRRLMRALSGALEAERERPPFTVVNTEQTVDFELCQGQLRLRLDRIDRQEDGTLLLIDYKTGRPSLAEWGGERPDAPQLPLYLLALGEKVEGLGYFRVRPGEECFIGLSSSPFSRLRRMDDARWSQTREEWRRVLSALMSRFLAGEVEVDPKRYPGSCRHCGLSTLCRVSELKRS